MRSWLPSLQPPPTTNKKLLYVPSFKSFDLPLWSVQKALPFLVYLSCALQLGQALARCLYVPRVTRSYRLLLKRCVMCVAVLNALLLWVVMVATLEHWLQHAAVDGDLQPAAWQRRLGELNAIDGRVMLACMYIMAGCMASAAYYFEMHSQLRTIMQ